MDLVCPNNGLAIDHQAETGNASPLDYDLRGHGIIQRSGTWRPIAKTSSRSETKINKAGKRKRRVTRAQAADRPHAEDDVDGCDVKFLGSEATPDVALPPAKGGVGRRRQQSSKQRAT